MLKVAHIQLLPLLSGVQRVSLNEIEYLKNEIEFSVVCKNDGPFPERLRQSSVAVFFLESLRREISPIDDVKSLFGLFRLFRKHKFDVVHTHSSKTGFVGRIAARFAGCKAVIHTVHGFPFPAAKSKLSWGFYFLMEWIAKHFTHKLVVMNQDDKKFAIERLGYHKSRVLYQANGVNTSVFSPRQVSGSKTIESRKLKVVMVGRLWEQKDPLTLVQAALKVLSENNGFQFDFVGDGELMESLQSLVRSSGLADQIRFLGWQNEIHCLLPDYDIFVLPSKWEGMPLAILEAMSCGLPVIATDIPGNSDLVDSGTDGFLFDMGDVGELANLLLKYRNDPGLVIQHGKAARDKIEAEFDIKTRHTNMAQLYRTMTASSK